MTPRSGYTTSLILSGGGSYAAYEIGVMKALFSGHSPATNHVPLDPDLRIGTSAGAMNAAGVLAQEVRHGSLVAAIEKLEALWTEWIANRDDLQFMMFPRLLGFAEIGWSPQSARRWPDYRVRLAQQGPRLDARGIFFYRTDEVDWVPTS